MDCSWKASSSHHEYHIGGVLVKFPVKAYPTQMAMMAKIIQALNHRDNALLESPTGSGKSLALLCSALAWQRQEYVKIEQEEIKERMKAMENANATCRCGCYGNIQAIPTPQLHPLIVHPPLTNSRITIDLTSSPGLTPTPQTVPIQGAGGLFAPQLFHIPMVTGISLSQVPAAASQGGAGPVVKADIEQLDGTTRPLSTERSMDVPHEQFIAQLDGSTRPSTSKENTNGETSAAEGDNKSGDSDKVTEGVSNKAGGDETDDGDFKVSQKRFRTPSVAEKSSKKRRTKNRGVKYEDAPEDEGVNEVSTWSGGQPQWKMEFPSGVFPGLGVPQSQIMDSDHQAQSVKTKAPNTGSVKTEPSSAGSVKTEPSSAGSLKAEVPNTGSVNASTVGLVPPFNVAAPSCPKCGCSTGKVPEQAKSDNVARRLKVPKIFFSTRTHKQIAQITHELARTAYSETPMCILASREHTCIHPEVSKSRNKNEECKKKLDGMEGELCSYYLNVNKRLGSQAQLRQHGFTSAWDIEDLVSLGKRTRTCPYFTTRGLMEEADIIFCPYNYLIDPLIRDQMLLEIENKVIILDEAHNMEDSAREAASHSITSTQLQTVSEEINKVLELLDSPDLLKLRDSYRQLQAFNASVLRWIEVSSTTLTARGYEQVYGIWSGPDFLPIMERQLGVTATTLVMYKAHLESIFEANSDKEQRDVTPSISVNSLSLFKSVFMVMSYLFKDNSHFLSDYRMSLMKSMTSVSSTEPGGWMSRKRRSRAPERVWIYTLNFWCLNPAVAFSDMTMARSIVLTSGTLSPMSSFSSELGVSFPIQLEANHIIPESQTWITSISHGPNGRSLIANYQNTETFEFQDELGEVLLQVCQTVPYGVLCFLSSYKMLEKLTNRWQDTGVWYKILREKLIVSEPRSGRKEDFESAMNSFYSIVTESSPQRTSPSGEECQTGALFLAVCRGKVSEGLDFANNNARAVVTVGIPFPSIKDKQVELKREYNNEHSRSRGLLTGSEWYEIQAYRALNQALGRCIRHKKDWGALILVDERYSKGPHYTKGLSKWVRQRICHKRDFAQALSSLRGFIEHRTRADQTDVNASSLSTCDPNKSTITCGSPSLGASLSSPLLPSLPTGATPLYPSITHPPVNTSPSSAVHPHTHTPSHPNTPLKHPPTSPAVTSHVSMEKESGNILTSTPVSTKTGVKNKITDFVISARNDSCGGLISSTPLKSRFDHPGKTKTAPNTSITLSQLHSLAPSLTMATTDGPAVTQVSPSPPDVGLDDSLDEQKTFDPAHTPWLPMTTTKSAASEDPSERPSCNESPLCMSREESPILFNTPSTVGGCGEPLAMKLAKRALGVRDSTVTAAQQDTEERAQSANELEPDLASPKLPQPSVITESSKLSPPSLKTQLEDSPEQSSPPSDGEDLGRPTGDIDATPPLKLVTTPRSGRLGPIRRASEERSRGRGWGSPLGRPRGRRINTRMASKKTAGDKQVTVSAHYAGAGVKMEVDDDFRTLKDKRSTGQSKELGSIISCSSCGTHLSETVDQVEKVELRRFFSDVCGVHKVKSSKLWQTLAGDRSKKRTLHTFAFNSQLAKCHSLEGDGPYNAVWDSDLGLCYSVVKCCQEQLFGVAVHASTDSSHPLVGKTLLIQDQVALRSE